MNNYIIEKNIYPKTDEEKLRYETLFHVANGYMGLRGSIEENCAHPGTYINGVYDIVDFEQAEPLFGLPTKKDTIVNVCDLQNLKVYINDKLIDFNKCEVLKFNQSLDMKKGIQYRTTKYKSKEGYIIDIKSSRLASFVYRNLLIMNLEVQVEKNNSVSIERSIKNGVFNYKKDNDPRANHKTIAPTISIFADENTLKSKTKTSNIEITLKAKFNCNSNTIISYDKNTIKCKASDNNIIKMETHIAIYDSIRKYNIENNLLNLNSEHIENEQEKYLQKFWNNSKIEIKGNSKLEKAINYNLFQLEQSRCPDFYGHLGAKGLSGEGYEGHYFWDTEMYCQTFFTLTNPKASKQLLMYRYRTMKAAIDNAKILGHKKGALYPWRTIAGKECSGYFLSGTAQYHIDGAIAYAIILYYRITKDKEFMNNYGMNMLSQICYLYEDLVCLYKDHYEVHEVTGPDEYTCLVSNNYYTNASIKYDIDNFLNIAKDLNYKINEERQTLLIDIKNRIYLPHSTELDISLQDDSFIRKPIWDIKNTPKEDFPLLLNHHPLELYRYQVCKQPDVILSHCIYPDYQDENCMLNSYEYYKKITTHDSSLSPTIFSINAARLGKEQEAIDFFGDSAFLDLDDLKHNTSDGIHTANMGGCYLAIVFGFGGLSFSQNKISLNPILPETWQEYSFSFYYKDNKIKVTVNKNGTEIQATKKILININGKEKIIKGTEHESCNI